LVAIGVNESGYREILGICEGAKEDKTGWGAFLKHLKERGLKGVRLITSDACIGLAESTAEFFPEAAWQRCIVGSLRKEPPDPVYAAISPIMGHRQSRRAEAVRGVANVLQRTIQRRTSARRAAASRLRLMAAAVR